MFDNIFNQNNQPTWDDIISDFAETQDQLTELVEETHRMMVDSIILEYKSEHHNNDVDPQDRVLLYSLVDWDREDILDYLRGYV